MAKQILTKKNDKLDELKLRVIKLIEEAVKSTLGPAGKFVLIDQGYSSKMTKDGVSVAKAVELKNPEENAWASFFKTAASHTVDEAGDGTTTSIVLASAIFKAALRGVSFGANSVEVKKGIEEAVRIALQAIQELKVTVAKDFEKIKQVAIVSANGDEEIGSLITQAFEKIGADGVITVEEGKTKEHDLKVVDGMQFDRGYISPHFSTNVEKRIAELENPYILVCDKKISTVQSILSILKGVKESGRSLLIIAEDIDADVVSTLAFNKIQGVLKVAAVKAPGFGDRRKAICEDISILTGATFIAEEAGYKLDISGVEVLGSAKRVIVTANETTIVEGAGDDADVDQRKSQIRAQIGEADSEYDKEKLQERLAKLAGGVAVLRVGGPTEEAAKECKDRVDDAVQAVKAAIAEGIVPGGATSLLYARSAIEFKLSDVSGDRKIGYESVLEAMEAPIRAIIENAGRSDAAVVLSNIYSEQSKNSKNYGLDLRSNSYGDLVKMGVIDPLKVIRCALLNASSVAGMMLVCDVSITNLPEKESEHGGMPNMPMMG